MDRDVANAIISRFVVNRMSYHKQKYTRMRYGAGYTFHEYLWDIRNQYRDVKFSYGPPCLGCSSEIIDPTWISSEFCSLDCLEHEKDPLPDTTCRGCHKEIRTTSYKEYGTCSHKCLLRYIHRVRWGDFDYS